jgi:hypothetical protein
LSADLNSLAYAKSAGMSRLSDGPQMENSHRRSFSLPTTTALVRAAERMFRISARSFRKMFSVSRVDRDILACCARSALLTKCGKEPTLCFHPIRTQSSSRAAFKAALWRENLASALAREILGLRFQLVLAHFIVNAPGRDPQKPGGLRLIAPHALHRSFQCVSFAAFQ